MRRINIPAMVPVNVFIDLEPLAVLTIHIRKYPEHGFFIPFAGAAIVALMAVMVFELIKNPVNGLMAMSRLKQDVSKIFPVAADSVPGAWMYVVFDSMIYKDIRPFYPFDSNPFYGKMDPPEVRMTCIVLMDAAVAVYGVIPAGRRHNKAL
ncbi:MAG: hypothetical protein LLG37_04370 [Spirochaetia bacterium]|nr:hypothetical protein [Spirochaetia bacterium]